MEISVIHWICITFIVFVLALEKRLLLQRRAAIPIRIHVHGTRGKSTTVRYLYDELRARGFRVLAKTTGDQPEYNLPDGNTEPIRRFSPARITEHIRIFNKAAQLGVNALVVEGMALQRETVWFSQQILCPTHVVITNVRPDHAESMVKGFRALPQRLLWLQRRGASFVYRKKAG